MSASSIPPPYDLDRIYEIPMKEIFADIDFNCRGVIDPTSVIELAKDIAQKGLQFPILVQPWSSEKTPGKYFRIVAGYRRFKAHQINNAEMIRCMVRQGLPDLEARLLNLSENLQREELDIMQEAQAINHFRKAGWAEQETALRVGKSRGWVQTRYMLLDLPEEIQKEAAVGMLTQQQIRECYSLGASDLQYEYVKKVKDQKLLKKKKEPKAKDVIVKNDRRSRSREEIFELQDVIRETFSGKNTLANRVLGWAAGEISDLEVHRSLKEDAEKYGLYYSLPDGLEGRNAPAKAFERALKVGSSA